MLRANSETDEFQGDPAHLRELAGLTLRAYRKLNEAAAEARYQANDRSDKDDLAHAVKLLQEVVSGLKSAAKNKAESKQSRD